MTPTSGRMLSRKALARRVTRFAAGTRSGCGRLVSVRSERPLQAAEVTKASAGVVEAGARMRGEAQAGLGRLRRAERSSAVGGAALLKGPRDARPKSKECPVITALLTACLAWFAEGRAIGPSLRLTPEHADPRSGLHGRLIPSKRGATTTLVSRIARNYGRSTSLQKSRTQLSAGASRPTGPQLTTPADAHLAISETLARRRSRPAFAFARVSRADANAWLPMSPSAVACDACADVASVIASSDERARRGPSRSWLLSREGQADCPALVGVSEVGEPRRMRAAVSRPPGRVRSVSRDGAGGGAEA